jgi:hypothetical protein
MFPFIICFSSLGWQFLFFARTHTVRRTVFLSVMTPFV